MELGEISIATGGASLRYLQLYSKAEELTIMPFGFEANVCQILIILFRNTAL